MTLIYTPCPCVPAPICPPPTGGNGGNNVVLIPCTQLRLPNSGSENSNFNGGGAVIGGSNTASPSPGPDQAPVPQLKREGRDIFSDKATLGVALTNPPSVSVPLSDRPVGDGPTFDEPNPNFIIYDKEYNYEIATDRTVLSLANKETSNSYLLDPTNLFSSSIPKILADVLLYNRGRGESSSFNGVTLGSMLYQSSIVDKYFNTTTRDLLKQIENANIASISLSSYLQDSIKRAVIDGASQNYSVNFFNNIITQSKTNFPMGTPQPVEQATKRGLGYSMVLQHRQSLNPGAYNNGVGQRNIRLAYIPPTDIDLCFSVTARSGEETGIRVSDSNTISVIKQDLSEATITEQNEFYPVTKQDLSEVTVALPSRRNEAFYLPPSTRGIVDGMFYNSRDVNKEYSYTITAEADWQTGAESVEVSGGDSAIPVGMLYSLIPSSLTKTTSPNSEFKTTEALYQLSWTSGEEDSVFNTVVSKYSGPRTSIYINPKNPFMDVMLTPSGDGERYLKLTFNDMDVPLEGIYPRQIFSDFMILAADDPTYDPYYGTESTLDQYTEGLPVKRSIRVINNPFLEVQNEEYTKTVKSPTGKGIDNQADEWAFIYEKSFSSEDKIKNLSQETLDNFTSQKSILGTILTTVSSIDTNYDLQDGHKGKQLPQGDFYSLLTLPQLINFIVEIPSSVISKVWDGSYNNVKIIPIRISDTEKSYLTSARLKSGGTDLLSSRKQTIIPQDLSYFDIQYKGQLY